MLADFFGNLFILPAWIAYNRLAFDDALEQLASPPSAMNSAASSLPPNAQMLFLTAPLPGTIGPAGWH